MHLFPLLFLVLVITFYYQGMKLTIDLLHHQILYCFPYHNYLHQWFLLFGNLLHPYRSYFEFQGQMWIMYCLLFLYCLRVHHRHYNLKVVISLTNILNLNLNFI